MSLNNGYLIKKTCKPHKPAESRKNQWTIQGPTDTCKWYLDNRIKTRLKDTQHKKGYTIQRAHSHIIIDVPLDTKGGLNVSKSHNHMCHQRLKAVLMLVRHITTCAIRD